MKKLMAVFALGSAALAAVPAQAADAEIVWQNPGEYRDIQVSNTGSQKKFQERVFDKLTRHFQTMAARHLPAQQTLHVEVTDVDLAGYVEYFLLPNNQSVQLVDDLFMPALSFNYELRDDQDRVIDRGEAKLKERSNLLYFGSALIDRNDSLFFEKRLIDQWFRESFFDPANS